MVAERVDKESPTKSKDAHWLNASGVRRWKSSVLKKPMKDLPKTTTQRLNAVVLHFSIRELEVRTLTCRRAQLVKSEPECEAQAL